RARLVELDPVLADRGRQRAAALGLTGVEFREADAGEARSFEGAVPAEPDYIADAHTIDLTRWIQDSSQPLEVRRRVRDELIRREPIAEEGWELDAIRWVLATHGRRL
ncbi:MAG TPA: hypothetical protein VMF04_04325, partial [Thermoplasmata archaeon]|nr:hypothetical protein [Thermoplasmata archaeon]